MDADVFSQNMFLSLLGSQILGVKLDLDSHRDMAQLYGITGIPATILLSPDGQEIHRSIGRQSLDAYLSMIRRHVSRTDQGKPSQAHAEPPKMPQPGKIQPGWSDVEVRYAKKAAELADLEYQKAIEANRRLNGTVPQLEVNRLRLQAEMAHLQIEQAQRELDLKQQPRVLPAGIGINSDAGLTGTIVLNEKNAETVAIEPPTDAEVLKALRKQQKAKGIPELTDIKGKNLKITKEKVSGIHRPAQVLPARWAGPTAQSSAQMQSSV